LQLQRATSNPTHENTILSAIFFCLKYISDSTTQPHYCITTAEQELKAQVRVKDSQLERANSDLELKNTEIAALKSGNEVCLLQSVAVCSDKYKYINMYSDISFLLKIVLKNTEIVTLKSCSEVSLLRCFVVGQ